MRSFGRVQIPQRTDDQLRMMRAAGAVVADMHVQIRAALEPGVTTDDLDRVGRDVIAEHRATSNFLGYHGFPAVICASVNDEVVHGIPGPRVLHDGDVVSIDCGAIVDGWHGDAAFTAIVGTPGDDDVRLVAAADDALAAAIDEMRVGRHLGDIGAAIDAVVRAAGFGSPRDYCGHGIGRAMHESPDVENRGTRGRGPRLDVGMVLAIEPMLIAGGTDEVDVGDDGWTVVTADGSHAAHTEHTVLVGRRGPEILTRS